MSVFQTVVAEVSPDFVKTLQNIHDSRSKHGATSWKQLLQDRVRCGFPAVEILFEDVDDSCKLRIFGMWDELSAIQLAFTSWKKDQESGNRLLDLDIPERTFSDASCQTEGASIAENSLKKPILKEPKLESLGVEGVPTKARKRKAQESAALSVLPRKSPRVPRKKVMDDYMTSSQSASQSKRTKNEKSKPSEVQIIPVKEESLSFSSIDLLLPGIDGKNEYETSDASDEQLSSAAVAELDQTTKDSAESSSVETKQEKEFPLFEDATNRDVLSDTAKGKEKKSRKPRIAKYSCRHCSFTTSVQRNLKCHEKRNHMEKIYGCEICDKAFGLKKDLTRHMTQHSGKLACSEEGCKATFEKQCQLKRHLRVVHHYDQKQIANSNKYSCSSCSYSSCSLPNLLSHEIRIHGEKTHTCSICDKRFALLKDLKQHVRAHSDSFCCEICGKQLGSKYGLLKHVDIIHNNVKRCPGKTYLCTVCGAFCRSKTQYKIHMNREHLKVKPFKCKVCDMAFFAKANLTVHLAVHSEERNCVCNVCGKSFKQAQSLRIHKFSHANVRPFKCDTCDKAFTQKGALVRHKRIHTGEKPYACKLCTASFSDYSILRRHVLAIHKIDDHHLVRRTTDDEKTKEIIESLSSQLNESESDLRNPRKRSSKKSHSKDNGSIILTEMKSEIDIGDVQAVKTDVDFNIVNAVLENQSTELVNQTNVTINANQAPITEIRVLPDQYDRMSIILQAAQQSLITNGLAGIAATNSAEPSNDRLLEVQAVEVLSHLHQPSSSASSEQSATNIIQIPTSSLLQQTLSVPIVQQGTDIAMLTVQEELQDIQEQNGDDVINSS